MAWLLLAAGLAILVAGAELLVRGAVGLAERLGITPLVVGLTVVALGTSSPEIAVSVSATHSDQPALALGNVVGSNAFNVLFILGLSALVRPLLVHQRLVRIDVPLMIAASVALWIMLADGSLDRLDSALLLAGAIAYTVLGIRLSRREPPAVRAEYAEAVPAKASRPLGVQIALVIVGLAGLMLGARWLVDGAVTIATALGVSELILGLTIVAAGTSLPEVATSLVAAVRGQRDIAVGNIIGSNIYNILAILGLTGVLAPRALPVPESLLAFDLPVMIAVALTCLPIVFTGHAVRRWEGALLLAGYVAYVTYLVLAAGDHDALSGFTAVMLWFALPLAALGILASLIGALRARARQRRR